jgi:hypothetical protein
MYCLKQVCVFTKCFVIFLYFSYLVDWNINYHLGLQLFEKVEATKPTASRSTSAEIYIICLKYKAPAKIQPELLDIKHLFSVVPEQTKVCWATCLNHLSSFFLSSSASIPWFWKCFVLCSLGMFWMVGKKDTVMGRSPCHIIAGVFLLVFSPSESMHLFYIYNR